LIDGWNEALRTSAALVVREREVERDRRELRQARGVEAGHRTLAVVPVASRFGTETNVWRFAVDT
jgi:hypothetical protein